MKSLVTLIQQSNEIETALIESGGELTPDLERMIDELDITLPEKVDSYQYKLERLKMFEQYWKEKASDASKIEKSCKRIQERLKENLKVAMGIADKGEIKGNDYRFKLSPTQKKLVIRDEGLLPGKWLRQEVKWVPDTARIKEALEAGEEIPGCELTGGLAIRSYKNNPTKG